MTLPIRLKLSELSENQVKQAGEIVAKDWLWSLGGEYWVGPRRWRVYVDDVCKDMLEHKGVFYSKMPDYLKVEEPVEPIPFDPWFPIEEEPIALEPEETDEELPSELVCDNDKNGLFEKIKDEAKTFILTVKPQLK